MATVEPIAHDRTIDFGMKLHPKRTPVAKCLWREIGPRQLDRALGQCEIVTVPLKPRAAADPWSIAVDVVPSDLGTRGAGHGAAECCGECLRSEAHSQNWHRSFVGVA